MDELNDILNRIGDFYFHADEEELALTGTLNRVNSEIILEARTARENLKHINQCGTFQIWGTIGGTKVTLLDSLVTVHLSFDSSTDYENVSAEPTEIIIGRCYVGDINVTEISATISAMNYMFSEELFEENICFSKENPSVLSFAYPPDIMACDPDGEIHISRSFQHKWSKDKIEYEFLPSVEYTFSKPIKIRNAISKIASARNLLSFFADYYLPLENISFADEQTAKVEGFAGLCDCQLYLNYTEDIEIPQRPFLIMTSKYSENFSTIWRNWLKFYNDNIYITTLFCEIISNHSTRINRFLNLTQSIELYSNYYREAEAKSVAQADGCNKNNFPLKYRLEDIWEFLNDCLDIPSEKKKQLAVAISKDRNFFTHYNKQRYEEPSVQEVLAANRFLKFVLLSIVYKTIGISIDAIKDCRHFEYSMLERDILVILREEKD